MKKNTLILLFKYYAELTHVLSILADYVSTKY